MTSRWEPHQPWTEAEIDRLRELVSQGLTRTQAANELGRSRNSVCGKIDRLGLKGPVREDWVYRGAKKRKKREATVSWARKSRVEIVKSLSVSPNKREVDLPGTVTFFDFDPGSQCHFIPGEPDGAATLFCGEPVVSGLPYCLDHCRMCYQPVRSAAQKQSAMANLAAARRAKQQAMLGVRHAVRLIPRCQRRR